MKKLTLFTLILVIGICFSACDVLNSISGSLPEENATTDSTKDDNKTPVDSSDADSYSVNDFADAWNAAQAALFELADNYRDASIDLNAYSNEFPSEFTLSGSALNILGADINSITVKENSTLTVGKIGDEDFVSLSEAINGGTLVFNITGADVSVNYTPDTSDDSQVDSSSIYVNPQGVIPQISSDDVVQNGAEFSISYNYIKKLLSAYSIDNSVLTHFGITEGELPLLAYTVDMSMFKTNGTLIFRIKNNATNKYYIDCRSSVCNSGNIKSLILNAYCANSKNILASASGDEDGNISGSVVTRDTNNATSETVSFSFNKKTINESCTFGYEQKQNSIATLSYSTTYSRTADSISGTLSFTLSDLSILSVQNLGAISFNGDFEIQQRDNDISSLSLNGACFIDAYSAAISLDLTMPDTVTGSQEIISLNILLSENGEELFSADVRGELFCASKSDIKCTFYISVYEDGETTDYDLVFSTCADDEYQFTEQELVYLTRARNVAKNYNKHLSKINQINASAIKYYNSMDRYSAYRFYCYDQTDDIAYITYIDYSGKTVNTIISINYESYVPLCEKHTGNFRITEKSKLTAAAEKILSRISTDNTPIGYEHYMSSAKYRLSVWSEDLGLYVIVSPYEGAYTAELSYTDLSGTVYGDIHIHAYQLNADNTYCVIHDFKNYELMSWRCDLWLRCDCGVDLRPKQAMHTFEESPILICDLNGSSPKIEYVKCSVCSIHILILTDADGNRIIIELENDNSIYDYDFTSNGLTPPDYTNAVALTKIYPEFDNTSEFNCNIVIPNLTDSVGINILYADCDYVSDNIISEVNLVLPEGMVMILNGSFSGENLDSVVLPESLLLIKYKAFCGTKAAQTVLIPDGVVYIDPTAFDGRFYQP